MTDTNPPVAERAGPLRFVITTVQVLLFIPIQILFAESATEKDRSESILSMVGRS